MVPEHLVAVMAKEKDVSKALGKHVLAGLTVAEFIANNPNIDKKQAKSWARACIRCGFSYMFERTLGRLEWIERELIVREFGAKRND